MKLHCLPGVASVFTALATAPLAGASSDPSTPSVFNPHSTPAHDIYHLSLFVMAICLAIFLVVFSLIVYAAIKFRSRGSDGGNEPPQIYGSNQVELAWTVIPILIVVVLFLASARVIHAVEDAPFPPDAIVVNVIGHQFWWEFQYPGFGFVTANELHVPLSEATHPTPTHIILLSADTDHSFWVPQLAGKTDLIPNRKNEMWIDPHEVGTYVGQCAQYCGTQHAKMLMRVIVQSPEDFQRWVQQQKAPATVSDQVTGGRRLFEANSCVNCHTIAGTAANGKFGPDLTHLMSRTTIAAGAARNTQDNLRLWVEEPAAIKPGCLMPAMQLERVDIDSLVAYLMSLH
ncbi:MAG TPA: cytochrome c oxidase subunit II [Candidatus Acidoferrum sp.]